MNIELYHRKEPDFRARMEPFEPEKFELVTTLDVHSDGEEGLEEAYRRTQNIDSAWRPQQPCRSTSVGDVMASGGKFYVVASFGFEELPVATTSSVRQGFVIAHNDDGVYLGNALGLAFFSNLDAVGQNEAVAFPDEATAQEHLNAWPAPSKDSGYRFVCVEMTERNTATIEACVKAGLPAWDPSQ